MVHALTLEVIGEDCNNRFRLYKKRLPGIGPVLGRSPFPEPWVAKITGLDPRYGFKRDFVVGQKDYRLSNSSGSRGVTKTFWLHSGHVYEVCYRISWKNIRRYFCRIDHDGSLIVMTEQEVRAWLENNRSE